MTAPVGDACWVCASNRTVPWKARTLPRELAAEDLRITDARYGVTLSLRRCQDCGFGFADDLEVGELLNLYQDLVDPGYQESEGPRLLQMRRLAAEARRHHIGARTALDIGAGSGLLVAALQEAGLTAIGVEPSRSLAHIASGEGRAVLQGALPHPDLGNQCFDLVFLVDVIEHVADPVGLLRLAVDRLEGGGLLVVVTPDAGSFTARILGSRWWHLRLAHVGYFTRESLDRAASGAGLVAVHRGAARWFFEVGYLAERVAEYLPVGGLNRWAERHAIPRWLYRRVIPLNLGDSLAVVYRRSFAPS